MNRFLQAAACIAMLASTSAFGQSLLAKADIPFTFQVGKTTFPAGTYIVKESQSLLTFRAQAGSPAVLQMTVPTERKSASDEPKLEFQRYGNEYFLRNIWERESNKGVSLFKSKREKELAQRFRFTQTRDVALATMPPEHGSGR